MIYLASTSPRRKEILRKLKIRFRVARSRYRERPIPRVRASRLAVLHAAGKARLAVVRSRTGWVLGADTLIELAGRIFGKPRGRGDAFRMLKMLSGRRHHVYTGVALVSLETGKILSGCAKTSVAFRHLDDETIRRYISRARPFDKAGAYAIQDGRKMLVRSIRGSYTNVMGLPAELLRKLFKKIGGMPANGLDAAGWKD